MEHNKNNPKDEIDKLLYDYFKTHNEDVPIETSKAIDEALYKKKHKKHSSFKLSKIAAILILCFTMTTGLIFAKDILNFFNEIFNLKSTNIDNSGIVDAIANKNYIQNVDMDYIPIDDNYSIKVDYLMLDDLNLYLVFNVHSNKKIDENYRISIPDLVLTDQDGNVIYDSNQFNDNGNYLYVPVWNKIDTENKDNYRELLYLMTNGINNLKEINISFSKLVLYNSNIPSIISEMNSKITFNININDKFINNDVYTFSAIQNNNKINIEKCIVTDTGMYLLYKSKNINTKFSYNFNIKYNYRRLLGTDYNSQHYFLTYYNINKNDIKDTKYIIFLESYTNETIILYKV